MSKLTIAGFETSPAVQTWKGSAAYLQIFYFSNRPEAISFSTGEVWSPSLETFYREIECALADNVVTVPAFELDTTTDVVGPVGVSLKMRIQPASARRADDAGILLAEQWQVPTSLQGLTVVTYEMLRQHNSPAARQLADTAHLSRSQTELMIAGAVNVGNPATTSTLGRVEMDIPPADPAHPKAVGANSPRLPTVGTAEMLAGSVAVNSAQASAVAKIIVTSRTPNVTGALYCDPSEVTPGVAFVVRSTNLGDSGEISWLLFS